MLNNKANHVEQLLVYPGHECPCCVGRFGLEKGLLALMESQPARSRKEILKLNPLFIRQLPSWGHQVVHVETMMAAMKDGLPMLFKKWSRHLQTYPEMPYLLHFILVTRSDASLDVTTEILTTCEKASPFKKRQLESSIFPRFRLKKRWARPEIVHEVLRAFANQLDLSWGFGRNDRPYLAQLIVQFSDQLKQLQKRRLQNNPTTIAACTPQEEQEHHRNAARYLPTLVDGAYQGLAEIILPAMIRACAADTNLYGAGQIQSLLSEFFSAGGSYQQSRFDIAHLVLDIDPELLLFLDRHRDKLNSASLELMDRTRDGIIRNLEALRAEKVERDERRKAESLERLAEQAEQEREHQRIEAERAEHRETIQAARCESLPDMSRRLASLEPIARMTAVADQIGYAPASFPEDWAREFTDDFIAQLDANTLATLTEKTRGVQRGEWKMLHRRLQS